LAFLTPFSNPAADPPPVHLYFLASPFCDTTSNNKILESQSRFNVGLHGDLKDRTKFEARLSRMNGVEYRIVEGPAATADGDINPVWVFRKQNRQKRAGQEDQLTVLGTYYCIATNIYQAPSLLDIIRCRTVGYSRIVESWSSH
jgi:hypothetical protein